MTKKKIIVSVTNDLCTDNRVRRVCEFLVANNFVVTLVGRRLKSSLELPELPYKTKRFNLLFTKGALFYATYNLRLFFYLVFHKADVLLANDLDTLFANHWAKKFKRNCQLIYDSHEYFIGVPELEHEPRVRKFWHWIEKRTLPKVDKMYTVNQSIADLYKKEYAREIEVVRNISDYQRPNQLKTKEELGLPADKKLVILQGAGINIDRGAEELIEAIQLVDNAILLILGAGDVIHLLKEKVRTKNWSSKVLFFDKMPYLEMMNYTTLCDLGISLDKGTNVNYKNSLPNKIFDYIHANIPVLVSNLPELKKIVNQYQIGLICESHSPQEIAKSISTILNQTDLHAKFKSNTLTACNELSWKNELKILEKIYL